MTLPKTFASLSALLLLGFSLVALNAIQAQEEEEYTSVYAKRFPVIVAEAPDKALPVRMVKAPVKLGQQIIEGKDASKGHDHAQHAQIFREFYDAAAAKSLPMAEKKWEKFIADNTLPNGDYECPTTAHLCEWSKEELQRAKLLRAGKVVEAQRVERALPISRPLR